MAMAPVIAAELLKRYRSDDSPVRRGPRHGGRPAASAQVAAAPMARPVIPRHRAIDAHAFETLVVSAAARPHSHRAAQSAAGRAGVRAVARPLLATAAVVGIVGGTDAAHVLVHDPANRASGVSDTAVSEPMAAALLPATAASTASSAAAPAVPAPADPAASDPAATDPAAAGPASAAPGPAPGLPRVASALGLSAQRLSRDMHRTAIVLPGKVVPGSWVIPTYGRYTSCFCDRWGSFHYGIDLAGPLGTPIVAVGDGTVIKAGPANGFGNWVVIAHSNGDVSIYGHMRYYFVKVGDVVHAGEKIALIGAEGFSTGPHLHFEVHQGGLEGTKIDPVPWLRVRGITLGTYTGS